MGYAEQLLGPSDARALAERHDGDFIGNTPEECEDYVTCPDFWAEGIPKDLAEQIVHLMTVIEPVGVPVIGKPSIQDICHAYNALRALKRRAMEIAKEL